MSAMYVQAQLESTLDRLSNDEYVFYDEDWVEEAGEQFKSALRKQLDPQEREFRIRMSNIGKPLCQLQMESAGYKKKRLPYNHVIRMIMGDSLEAVTRVVMKMAGVGVTSEGDRVSLMVGDTEVKGDSDLDIDHTVYDIKTCSPTAFGKWEEGYSGLAKNDTWGYIGQLLGYADAQNKEPGGWVVINKSSGEIATVAFEAEGDVRQKIRDRREEVIDTIKNDKPLQRQFDDVEEFYYKKPTGAKKLGYPCTWCDYQADCWPNAEWKLHPKHVGKDLKNPSYAMYTEYPDIEE